MFCLCANKIRIDSQTLYLTTGLLYIMYIIFNHLDTNVETNLVDCSSIDDPEVGLSCYLLKERTLNVKLSQMVAEGWEILSVNKIPLKSETEDQNAITESHEYELEMERTLDGNIESQFCYFNSLEPNWLKLAGVKQVVTQIYA
jgi:hypothetical protein